MKFLNFILLSWDFFALLDTDPDSEYGSGSNPHPDTCSANSAYLASGFAPAVLSALNKTSVPVSPDDPIIHPENNFFSVIRSSLFF
jgi:hypothetical protein